MKRESVAEYCTRTGEKSRAVRGRLERGTLAGAKVGGRWYVITETAHDDHEKAHSAHKRERSAHDSEQKDVEDGKGSAQTADSAHDGTAQKERQEEQTAQKERQEEQTAHSKSLVLALESSQKLQAQLQQLNHEKHEELTLAIGRYSEALERVEKVHKSNNTKIFSVLLVSLLVTFIICGVIWHHFSVENNNIKLDKKESILSLKNEHETRISSLKNEHKDMLKMEMERLLKVNKENVERIEEMRSDERLELIGRNEKKTVELNSANEKIMLLSIELERLKMIASGNVKVVGGNTIY